MKRDENIWTLDAVKIRLEDAADCLRRLKASRHTWPAGHGSYWPDVVQDTWDAYGYTAARALPPRPAGREIDEMDAAIEWIEWIGAPAEIARITVRGWHRGAAAERLVFDRRRIVWARACKIPWRKLEDRDGRSISTLRTLQGDGFEAILRRLNRAHVEGVGAGVAGSGEGR